MTARVTAGLLRTLTAVAAGFAIALSGVGPALARAALVQAEPAPGAVLPAPPTVVRLRFSEPVDPGLSFIVVADEAGHRVDEGKTRLNTATPQILDIGLKPLRPGTYRVVWRVVGENKRPAHGDFIFIVKP